eukprot:UN32899
MISRLARRLNVLLIECNMFDYLGGSSSETCDRLKQLFKQAANMAPLILHIRRLSALKHEMTYHSLPNAAQTGNCFSSIFRTIKENKVEVGIICSCSDVYNIPTDIRSCFTSEMILDTMDKPERTESVDKLIQLSDVSNKKTLSEKISSQSAGLQLGELRDIVSDIIFSSFQKNQSKGKLKVENLK